MVNYQNGKIYKLWSDQSDCFYIGSTTTPLYKRLHNHKSDINTGRCTTNIDMRNHTNIRIELIEDYPCQRRDELHAREGHYVRLHREKILNKNIPCRTLQEYRAENKEVISEKKKEYREANKEKISKHSKEYYEANKEEILKHVKEYREANKEVVSNRKKKYREANKEKIAKYKKEYSEANKEAIAKHQKEYHEAKKRKQLSL